MKDISLYVFAFYLLISCLIYAQKPGYDKKQILKSSENIPFLKIDINNIEMWFSNSTLGVWKPDNASHGFFYPKGSGKPLVYMDGPLLGGMVADTLRMVGSTYISAFQPGSIINGTTVDSFGSRGKIFKIRKDWQYLPDSPERTQYQYDYDKWPIEDGAPYTLDKTGKKIPKFIGDEQAWFIVNDLNNSKTHAFFGTDPVTAEVQCLIWVYNSPDVFANVIFRKYTFINKGTNDLDQAYLAIWSDADVGDANDDFCGCDTTLSLGYVYNGTLIDNIYGKIVPAIGYCILQGPKVKSFNSNEYANWNFEEKSKFKNLPMTSFIFFNRGPGIPDYTSEPPLGTYNGGIMMYNSMKGLRMNGNIWINDQNGLPTKFLYPGDPFSHTGWFDGIMNIPLFELGDKRILLSSGPFEFMEKDTQEFVAATIVGNGADRLSSISVLKYYTMLIKASFNDEFADRSITLSDEEVNFFSIPNEIYPSWKIITITNPSEKTLNWEVSTDADWLEVTPKNGSNSNPIEIKINNINIGKGLHTAKVKVDITAGLFLRVTRIITVKYLIDDIQPYMTVSVNKLSFNIKSFSQSAYSQMFFIKNVCGETLDWKINNDYAEWLDVKPMSGSGGENITASINKIDLLPGKYSTALNITSPFASNTPQKINVEYIVDPPFPKDTVIAIPIYRSSTIMQNYPNPFNSTTTIEFTIPYKSFVTGKMFDISGQEVAILFSEIFSPGVHDINWNAGMLPSGVYLFKLTVSGIEPPNTGIYTDMKKIILMK